MKLTIKNLEKRYGVKIHSVMNHEIGKMMWMIQHNNTEIYFDTKEKVYEYLKVKNDSKI